MVLPFSASESRNFAARHVLAYGMDRTDLRRLLTATEREIAQGEILIQNQRWRIEQLHREGQDTADAEEALHALVRNQAVQEQHCAMLKPPAPADAARWSRRSGFSV
jgi:hypothetical protein